MPKSLFDKARVAVLSQMHSLLDRAVNTPEGYKQYIRDLESALADLRAAVDEAVGTANGYKREKTELQSVIAETQANIDLLLGDDDPENDVWAIQLQLNLQQMEDQVANLDELIAETEASKLALDSAVDKLEQRHSQMVGDYRKLTLTAATTKAKTKAADAAEAAADAVDAAGEADIDSVSRELNHRKDVADARFERVIGGLQSNKSAEEVAALARAKEALAKRRAEIVSASS